MFKDKRTIKVIICAVMLIAYFAVSFSLVYNAEILPKLEEQNIKITLMNKHKDNQKLEMNGVASVYYQDFYGEFDDLKILRVKCKRKGSDEDAYIYFKLVDVDTYEEYAVTSGYVNDLIKTSTTYVKIPVPEKNRNLKGKHLRLYVEMQEAVMTRVYITTNYRQGLVYSVNDNPGYRYNIIYNMEYGQKIWLSKLYFVIVFLISIFLAVGFYLFIIKKYDIAKAYLPMALILGAIICLIFMPHGIPDEPSHIDTAYQLSNIMMGKGKAGDGVVSKRMCDVVQDDLLVNGVESNSYFQLKQNLLKRPQDTEMVNVIFDDAGRIVPDITYLPMAIGITIGRLLGLSTLLTYYLGRFLNLIVFVILTSLAIKITPHGKNLIAMVMLLPISLQQASSASYDSMINAVLILYMAYILMVYSREEMHKKDYAILLALSAFIVMCKGGVYAPLCIMLLALPYGIKNRKGGKLILAISILLVLAGILIWTGYPVLKTVLVDGTVRAESEIYTFSDMADDPIKVIHMWWMTMVQRGGSLLAGILGGRLAWLDVKANWIFLTILSSGLLMLTNVENDKLEVKTSQKACIVVSHIIIILMIVASMVVGFTKIDSTVIQGLQGRYFLPILPLSLLLINTDMINLKKEKLYKLAMIMMATEAMIVIECIPQMLG